MTPQMNWGEHKIFNHKEQQTQDSNGKAKAENTRFIGNHLLN